MRITQDLPEEESLEEEGHVSQWMDLSRWLVERIAGNHGFSHRLSHEFPIKAYFITILSYKNMVFPWFSVGFLSWPLLYCRVANKPAVPALSYLGGPSRS